MRKCLLYFVFLILCFTCCFTPLIARNEKSRQEISGEWLSRFKISLRTGSVKHIQPFFEPGFAVDELKTWKYQLQRGYLDFDSAVVIPLTGDTLFLLIPTDSSSYSGENFDRYFDFIYRLYRVKPASHSSASVSSSGFAVTARCMDDLNPDFLTSNETFELFPATRTMSVDSGITANIKCNWLIFKLAKEFQLKSLTINGKKHSFRRYGYFVFAKVQAPNPISFKVKGNITAVSDHNQFFCIDDKNFFLRSGGFAAAPSPPPDNRGRPYFSDDKVTLNRVISFPARYKLLVYGDIIKDETRDGTRTVSTRLTDRYGDGPSFYAQTGWNVKTIRRGNIKAGFYFPTSAQKEQDFLVREINALLDWLNRVFKKDPGSEFAINFVVLDKFVRSGLLNDGHSIIASEASIIGSGGGGYIHELCHLAPQPHIDGNVLWVKEGFTNYLAFNFLRDIKGEPGFWKQQKRRILHRFGLYCEPLEAITNKGIPCYWSVYQKGPWIYRMLETELGAKNFGNAMTAFGKREGETLTYVRDYFKIFEIAGGKDLSAFRRQWLERKQNPVLRVRHTVRPGQDTRGGGMLNIHVSQEAPVFHFPLDIEIKTEKQTIRRTMQLNSREKTMSVPIYSQLVSVRYDPDARVFAFIKEGTPSFLHPSKLRTPIADARFRFKSGKDNRIVEFEIKTRGRGIDLFRREGKEEQRLELTRELSPRTFYRDGKKMYSIDTASGKIQFPDASYDIAEPVYPRSFAIILFALADWEKTSEASFVGLSNSGYGSRVITAAKETGKDYRTIIRLDGLGSPVKIFLSKGLPIKYTTGKGGETETFTRIPGDTYDSRYRVTAKRRNSRF